MIVDVVNYNGRVIGSFENEAAGQGSAFMFVAMQPVTMVWLYKEGKLMVPENDAWAIESLPNWKPA